MDNITVLDIAAGQNTTFIIGRPPPTPTELAAVASESESKSSASATTSKTTEISTVPATTTSNSVDLSGFGFSFGPPVTNASSTAAVVAAVEVKKEVSDGISLKDSISRTETGPWEELGRYPLEVQAQDACLICGDEEKEEESLECEMVSNFFVFFLARWFFKAQILMFFIFFL